MFSIRRHHDHAERTRRVSQPAGLDPRLIPVSVSADVLEEFPTLHEALGERFVLMVDEPDACAVAVVGPVGPVGVAFLTMAHPGPALLVVDHARVDPRTAAACLDAGAAGYISRPTAAEVALGIRVLACPPPVDVDVRALAS